MSARGGSKGTDGLPPLSLLSPVERTQLGRGVTTLGAGPTAIRRHARSDPGLGAEGSGGRLKTDFFCRWNDRELHLRQIVCVLVCRLPL